MMGPVHTGLAAGACQNSQAGRTSLRKVAVPVVSLRGVSIAAFLSGGKALES